MEFIKKLIDKEMVIIKKQVFIIGLDDFNFKKLKRLPEAEYCEFLPALYFSEIRCVEEYNIQNLIDLCSQRIEENGKIDAVASYYDFPGNILVPIIAGKYGVPSPSLESVIKCEHKFWSRLEQSKVIEDHIPFFKTFDPFDDKAYEKLGMIPPFWIKPIKSFRSYLAFRISSEVQFYEHLKEIRENIDYITKPFIDLMRMYEMPQEFAEMKESCIAESLLTGQQCTLEGYVTEGKVICYGIVDSIKEGGTSSFSRYEYPSSLPQEIHFRMADITRRIITQVGLDNYPFNIEYFYDQTADEVYLVEINSRVSQAHTDIFEKVHGTSHLSVMVNLALGQKPQPFHYDGKFNRAANFMLRTYEPGTVMKTPSEEEIRSLKKRFPDLEIIIRVSEGMHLTELTGQDGYSYELANILIGGRDQQELIEKYNEIVSALTFDIDYDVKVHLY